MYYMDLHPLLYKQAAAAGVPRNHLALPPNVVVLLEQVSRT